MATETQKCDGAIVPERHLGRNIFATYEHGSLVLTVKHRGVIDNVLYLGQQEQVELERFCYAVRMARSKRIGDNER